MYPCYLPFRITCDASTWFPLLSSIVFSSFRLRNKIVKLDLGIRTHESAPIACLLPSCISTSANIRFFFHHFGHNYFVSRESEPIFIQCFSYFSSLQYFANDTAQIASTISQIYIFITRRTIDSPIRTECLDKFNARNQPVNSNLINHEYRKLGGTKQCGRNKEDDVLDYGRHVMNDRMFTGM